MSTLNAHSSVPSIVALGAGLVIACSKDPALIEAPWSSDQNAILIVTNEAGLPHESPPQVMLHDADFSSFRVEDAGKVRVFALVFPTSADGGPPLEKCAVEFSGAGEVLAEPEQVWSSDVFDSATAAATELHLDTMPPAFGLRLINCPEDQDCETPGDDELTLLRLGPPHYIFKTAVNALFPRTATTALAIAASEESSDTLFYEVTLDGTRPLPFRIPGVAMTAAYQSDDAFDRRVLIAGRGAERAELYAITSTFGFARYPSPPLEFAGGPSAIAMPLEQGADARSIYLLAEDGALWRFASDGWTQLASLNKPRGTLGLLAWNRPDELYLSPPDGHGIFRYASMAIEAETTPLISFEADRVTLLEKVSPLGIVVGTFEDVIFVGEHQQWTLKENSYLAQREIRTIVRYHGGYLIGGGFGYVFRYKANLERCEDLVNVGSSSIVTAIVALDGGLVVLIETGEGPPYTQAFY